MNVLLWVLQIALAVLYLSGGAYKLFKFDELAKYMTALSRGGWRALGVVEMLGAVLLIVPAVANWMPGLPPPRSRWKPWPSPRCTRGIRLNWPLQTRWFGPL